MSMGILSTAYGGLADRSDANATGVAMRPANRQPDAKAGNVTQAPIEFFSLPSLSRSHGRKGAAFPSRDSLAQSDRPDRCVGAIDRAFPLEVAANADRCAPRNPASAT